MATPAVVLFVLNGVPFALPSGWVTGENKSQSATVQMADNPQYMPVATQNDVSLSISLTIPTGNPLPTSGISLLKAGLEYMQNAITAEKYGNINYASPIRSSTIGQNKLPLTNITIPGYVGLICGYIGLNQFLLGGVVESFSSSYSPKTLNDTWQISLKSFPLDTLRKGAPVPESGSSSTIIKVTNNGQFGFNPALPPVGGT